MTLLHHVESVAIPVTGTVLAGLANPGDPGEVVPADGGAGPGTA